MASYRDVYTREIEGLFGNLGKSPFEPGGSQDSVPQEDGGRIQPSGWVKNSDGAGAATVVIDAAGIAVTQGILGSPETTIDISGVRVMTGGAERVRLGALGGGDYGLKVVNSGSTVIIDGTSNMFKIKTTGTFNGPSSSGAGVTATQVDVATGFTYAPAYLAYLEFASSVGAFLLPYLIWNHLDGLMFDHWEASVGVVNTNQTRVKVQLRTVRANSARVMRYYLLKEVAI